MKYVKILSRHPSHDHLRRRIRTRIPTVIRFGSTTLSTRKNQINTVHAVKNSSDKLLMKQCFEGLVNTCQWSQTPPTDMTFPIVAKHRKGSKGTGNYKLDSQEELDAFVQNRSSELGYFIFEKYSTYSREYRLHVSRAGCFYTCRKLRRDDTAQKDRWKFNNTTCIWVVEENPSFNKPNTWDLIVQDCQIAIASVGLDIGCCDVRVSKKGEWTIIETNSAPALGELGKEKYFNHLNNVICVD
jgi:hypothetical protein